MNKKARQLKTNKIRKQKHNIKQKQVKKNKNTA